jgi:hypothetical protein
MPFDARNLFAQKRLDQYPDHLEAIGLVTTEWVRLEKSMQVALAAILSSPKHAIILF